MDRNNFRHQEYRSEAALAKFELLSPDLPPQPGTVEFEERMANAGVRFQALGISTIGLMHGTFVGTDALGIIREIGRIAPGLSDRLQSGGKDLSDRLAGESGNFTPAFAATMADHINRDLHKPIEVKTFDWSSENNHSGRADAAIRLMDTMLERGTTFGRTLLLGHSHAGNVFALMTNLLAADDSTREKFFEATQSFYESDAGQVVDLPVWQRVRDRLSKQHASKWNVDIVTFGTPIRYGWDTSSINSLVHFIHHAPSENVPVFRAPFPPRGRGDWVQQIAIAGTDFLPYLLSRRTRLTEHKLSRLLQPDLRRRHLFERLKLGCRLHDAGLNLLVEYGDDEQHLRNSLLGHGIYTRREWLVFHVEEIASRLSDCSR